MFNVRQVATPVFRTSRHVGADWRAGRSQQSLAERDPEAGPRVSRSVVPPTYHLVIQHSCDIAIEHDHL